MVVHEYPQDTLRLVVEVVLNVVMSLLPGKAQVHPRLERGLAWLGVRSTVRKEHEEMLVSSIVLVRLVCTILRVRLQSMADIVDELIELVSAGVVIVACYLTVRQNVRDFVEVSGKV